ncbi:YchJ family protein [Desertivibrio insolitus]|uniref:YchJ family protein n=1 Tax=Herbiconiux sp. SYSU D00978 TaxID=2812562 RepID=UPI001A963047|nr:YchJ family protein [Herbiconiux sp. SYSU D00978]
MTSDAPCPCGSGTPYSGCCGPLHAGAPAPTALALMRSRFSAFALADAAYLSRTWHPSTRPDPLELDDDVVWRRLQIVDTTAGGEADTDGVVEFRASYRSAKSAGLMHERSRFTRHEGRWVYVDGDQLNDDLPR